MEEIGNLPAYRFRRQAVKHLQAFIQRLGLHTHRSELSADLCGGRAADRSGDPGCVGIGDNGGLWLHDQQALIGAAPF